MSNLKKIFLYLKTFMLSPKHLNMCFDLKSLFSLSDFFKQYVVFSPCMISTVHFLYHYLYIVIFLIIIACFSV